MVAAVISVHHTRVQAQTNSLKVSGRPPWVSPLLLRACPFLHVLKVLFINTDSFISKFEFINRYPYSGKQR